MQCCGDNYQPRHLVKYILILESMIAEQQSENVLTSFLIGMVAPTMLVLVGSDARCEGCGIR